MNASGMFVDVYRSRWMKQESLGKWLLLCGAEGHGGERAVVSVALSYLLTSCLVQ